MSRVGLVLVKPALTGPSPQARQGHSATFVQSLGTGGALLVFGGHDQSNLFNDVHTLDIAEQRWTRRAPGGELPCPRHRHGAVVVGQQAFMIMGGHDGTCRCTLRESQREAER